ncbi:MAG: formylglycine-generating enzyme family protein [Myxococcales bacterium]|nr:formylglycine-generating enzyme family protein [Myxococcales bacterium]
MTQPSRTPFATLSPTLVRGVGAGLVLAGLALPWVWLRQYQPPSPPIEHRSALRPEMRRLPPGKFKMGSPETEGGRDAIDERQHEVEIQTPFAISVTEVTQGQYAAVMGENPSEFKGDDARPVENVSWLDAVKYCNRLSKQEGLLPCYQIEGDEVTWPEGLKCRGYRLPTEAEWEYAARADGTMVYAGSEQADEVAWYSANSERTTHPVGGKRANAWGLHDLSGNVSEWVWDRYSNGLELLSAVDPTGPEGVLSRVFRGGSWAYDAHPARVASRVSVDYGIHNGSRGFRVSRSFP